MNISADSTSSARAGQVSDSAAEIYDAFFVPALFGEWAEPLCAAATLGAGDNVLDVACGTGATTRVARSIAGSKSQIVGLDRNRGMLDVAHARSPEIMWKEARAEALPFPDRTFDAALCQFGLMFFDDPVAALREIERVVRPGGRVAVSVWDDVDHSPGYARMIGLLDRMFGTEVAEALRAPFRLGRLPVLENLLAEAGWTHAAVTTRMGHAQFPSISEWVRLDVRGWTLADMIDDQQFDVLVEAACRELLEFANPDGTVSFAAPAHIISLKIQ